LSSAGLDPEVKQAFERSSALLKDAGHVLEPVSFEYLDYVVPTYYILTMDFVSLRKLYDKEYCDKLVILTSEIIEKYSSMTNQLFFISCGPISEIIIDVLYKANPNNTYIDVGSSIDEFVHGYKTRPYMYNTSPYSKLISKF
jgi:Asp-tRNA(Asn)/Glu-tRNA(Gln) amidotransferase A subunit family amidase